MYTLYVYAYIHLFICTVIKVLLFFGIETSMHMIAHRGMLTQTHAYKTPLWSHSIYTHAKNA